MKRLVMQCRAACLYMFAVLIVVALAACAAPATPAPAATTAPEATAATEVAAAAATEAPAATTAAGPTGDLRVGLEIPAQLDPGFASADSEIAVLNAVYDYLVDINTKNDIEPRLATQWEVSPDGKTYTFTLADKVMFHDGTPFTAEDVVWTFNRLRDPELELPTADLYANIESIEATPDGKVVFVLKETNPFFLYDLSDNHAVIVKKDTTDFTKFVGTGPFKVTSYSPENRMELEANPDYFIKGKPGVSKMEFIFFADQAAAVDALRGGQIDLTMRMPTPLFQTLQNEPGIKTFNIPTNGFDLVRLRADRAPGNDPMVVQALKLATDREAIAKLVTVDLGAVGRDSPIGPLFTAFYNENTPLPKRDAAQAKQVLVDAGYPDGLELDLHVPDTGDRPDLAAVLKEQWAEAGIDVNIIVEPESVYYGDNGWLDVDLGITGWGSRPVPQFYVDVMLTCGAKWNESHFCDEELDKWAKLAGTSPDRLDRVQAYNEIQRILIQRGPIIIPYFFAQLGAIRDSFEGFDLKAFAGRTDLAAVRQIQ